MVVLFAREIVATMMRCLACKHGVAMQTSLIAKVRLHRFMLHRQEKRVSHAPHISFYFQMKSIMLPIILCIMYGSQPLTSTPKTPIIL